MRSTKIFDIHIYAGKSLFGRDFLKQSVEKLAAGYPNLHMALIPTKPYDYLYPPANSLILEIAESSRQWFPVLRVDPWRLEEATKLVRSTRAQVLFLHPFEEQIYPTHPKVKSVVEEAAGKNMKIMMACGYLPFSHSSQILPLVQNFPNATFLLTHGAQINISGMHMHEAFEIFSRCPNTLFETSGIYREDYIEKAVKELGAERVLFGSGTPHYYFPYELKRIEYLAIDDNAKEKILYENAVRLFKQ